MIVSLQYRDECGSLSMSRLSSGVVQRELVLLIAFRVTSAAGGGSAGQKNEHIRSFRV